jgi:ABC-2 type transport system permease protein
MSTQVNAIPETKVSGDTTVPLMRRMYWLLRREIWEYRSIYLVPAATAAVVAVGFAIGAAHFPSKIQAATGMQQHEVMERPFVFAALLMMLPSLLVALYYSMDTLYGERRERSILFWKSMPVSDTETVLAKACVPIFVLPLVTFALTVVLHLFTLLIAGVAIAGHGMSVGEFVRNVSLPRMWLILLYHLVAMHGLWYAPFYGWLLMVSAWARRAPFLWAVMPPVIIAVFEKIAFNSMYLARMLQYRFIGGPAQMAHNDKMTMDMLQGIPFAQFLLGPGLWIGLLITAGFLFAAIRLRRDRGPI